MTVLKEFKQFLMRGNLVELAVAFVLGVVFASFSVCFAVLLVFFGK